MRSSLSLKCLRQNQFSESPWTGSLAGPSSSGQVYSSHKNGLAMLKLYSGLGPDLVRAGVEEALIRQKIPVAGILLCPLYVPRPWGSVTLKDS